MNPLNPKSWRFTPRQLIRYGLKCAKFHTIHNLGLDAPEKRFENIEGLSEYHFALPRRVDRKGVSAYIRARNEADRITMTLSSILGVFDQIVFVDNGSDDGTFDLVEKFKQDFDHRDTIELHSYPHTLAKWGRPFKETDENSVASHVYFANYALSRCRYRVACKWDADMILMADRYEDFKRFLARIGRGGFSRWSIVGQTLYQMTDGRFCWHPDEVATETRIAPTSYHHLFFKHFKCECFTSPLYRRVFPGRLFYELKRASTDETGFWQQGQVSFAHKKQEHAVLEQLQTRATAPQGYRVEAADFLDRYAQPRIGPVNAEAGDISDH